MTLFIPLTSLTILVATLLKKVCSNGYTSARGKVFKNPHIHSILKKKNIADNRMNKRYEPKIENLSLVFSHKTHTHQQL